MRLEQLIGFLIKASTDHRVGSHHIALYMALFQEWALLSEENPIPVSLSKMQKIAKIGRTKYHKCMHELDHYGYIRYFPSYSPFLESIVYMEDLKKVQDI